jgi:hypothetical protein
VSESKVVVGKGKKASRWPPRPEAVRSGLGSVTGWTGLTFLLVGGFDFALTWYPSDFGNREWEFGTVTASLNGLPVPTIGLVLLLAGAILLERRWWAGVVAVVSWVGMLWVLVGIVLWATTIPLAVQTVPPEVALGLKKAVAKSALQSLMYPVILAYLGWSAIGAMRGTIGARR